MEKMSNRDGYTTIRVSNKVAEKLRKIQQGSDATLSDVIWNCLQHIEGTVENDTENIYREQVAFDLQYVDADSSKVSVVTFRDCAESHFGDVFNANDDISATEYTNEYAEVIFKDKDSVVLRLTQESVNPETTRKFTNIVHISLL